ncbi:MAG TPA: ester cyclase [Burkholderiales bacterium]
MSSESKAVVRSYIEEVMNKGQGDITKFDRYVHGDAILHNAYPAQGSTAAAWKERVRIFAAAFSNIQVTVEDQLAEGDKVVTRTIFRGSHTGTFQGIPPTGKRIAADEIQITRIRDGRIAERWSLLDHVSLLKQLGRDPYRA